MKFNKYQTPLTDELLETLPQEVRDQLLDIINNVEFVRKLVSPDRQYAKDRPRDDKGRIIIDLANPHIVENVDFFRPTALHYQKYGCFTNLRPNANPNSEYGKWIREEKRRCWEGYVRESDGEWVTGYMYWFLNYSPIMLSKVIKGTKRANRVEDFPEFWEGIYWRFHYMEQASNGGLYNNFEGGQHCAELASRGKGKSFSLASILSHDFILGVNEVAHHRVMSVVTAYQKEYLTKDGVLNKFSSMANFCAEHTQFPRKRLKSSMQEMTWVMGYKDVELDVERGTLNNVLGVSSKDDESKLRGKRAAHILIEEFGCHIKGTKVLMYDGTLKNVEEIQEGDTLMGNDNTPRIVKKLYNGIDSLYKITLSNGDYQIVNSHHPVYFKKYDWNKKKYTEHTLTAPELLKIKNLNKGYYIPKASIKFPHKPLTIDPYFLGLWLGDGDSTRLDISNEDKEVLDWLSDNYTGTIRDLKQSKTCKVFHISKSHVYNKVFTKYNLYNNKHIPRDFKINSPEVQLQVIAGLIDTDGTYNKEKNFFEITQRYDRKHILEDIKFMCEANGLRCSLTSRIATGKKPGILHYRLRISGDVSIIPTKISRKRGKSNTRYKTRKNWGDYTFKVEPYERGEYYGFTVDKNHLFVLGDLTVTHNTFPRLTDMYNVLTPSVEEGDIVFGQIYMLGTAGDNESDFAGAQEIMYNPKGYRMYALPNVFDKNNQGRPNFVFFFPGYVNRKGCYNEDGVSDVIKALIEILMNRYTKKYNSSDPNTIIKVIAEVPITPAEAIVKTGVNMFPVVDLTERLQQLDNNPREFDDVYTGELVMNTKGEVEFRPGNQPIREFPHKDNKIEGAVELFQLPEIDRTTGKPFNSRYILGCDPYDDDASNTMSLGSVFVLDLWTDRIVAEYTGRPMFAEDFYEICRRLCLYYNGRMNYENNKKGLFSYFSKNNCTYLLTDQLEFLRDKQMIKDIGYGNKAHPYSQKVYTPDGIKTWGEIKIGDKLFNTNGGITTIVDVPYDDTTDIYEITLRDGRKVRASENHLWSVIDWNNKRKVLSTKEIMSNYYRVKGNYKEYKYYIPSNKGVEYNSVETKLPPYFMGIMLGDGCFTQSKHNQAYFTASIDDLETYKKNVPYEIKTYDNRHHRWKVDNIGKILTKYNLIDKTSHTKFIPDEYKYNSREVRLNLLQGLLDTDGTVGYGGNPEYTTTSKQLCCDIMEVARSLGINCNSQVHSNAYGSIFKVTFYTDINLFKLARKSVKQRVTKTRAYKTAIIDIKFIHKEKAKCVTVDSEDNCYLIGDFITTHNSKGTNATLAVNSYAKNLLRAWLLRPTIVIQDVDGEPTEVAIPALFNVRSRALIKELINFNNDGNFDRISAMGMLMLLREDKMITYQGNISKEKQERESASYLGNDPFFSRNYKPVNLAK